MMDASVVAEAHSSAALLLKPRYNKSTDLQTISAKLSLTNTNITKNSTIFYKRNALDNLQSCIADLSKVRIIDSQGHLPVRIRGDSSGEYYEVERDSTGTVVLEWGVTIAELETLSYYHKQEAGAILVGHWFIPEIAAETATQAVGILWDLDDAPSSTRAVCSFGEGPEMVGKAGSLDILLDCVFMIGPLQSYSKESMTSSDAEGPALSCATYWFGPLPQNLAGVTSYASDIFPRISHFFRDTNGSYRMFMRNVPRGFSGSTYHASSIIDYDTLTEDKHDFDLVRLLNHHMVASWTKLDAEENGMGNDWFSLGLAQLYSIFFPFRFKQRGPDYFRETINCFLSAYYTNPLATVPLGDVAEKVGMTWHAKSAILMRSCVYMLKMDAYTRRASREQEAGILRPIDEIVGDIVERRRKGETLRKSDWLEYLGHWLEQDAAEQYFQNFVDGKIMELDDMSNSFGEKDGPVPVEQEILSMGFDIESLDSKIVQGLVKGSRAEAAGLRNGDIIVWSDQPEKCELHFDSTFRMSISRNGHTHDLEFWPRKYETVRSWQVRRFVLPTV